MFETGKNFRYIPVHEIVASIVPSKPQALPVFMIIRAGAIFQYIDVSQYSPSQYCTFDYQFACKCEGSCKFLEKRTCLKPQNVNMLPFFLQENL